MSLETVSKKVSQNASKIPEGVKVALIKTAPAIRNGADWGFLREGATNYEEDLKDIAEAFKGRGGIVGHRVANGHIMHCDIKILEKAISILIPNEVPENFGDLQEERIQEAEKAIKQFAKKLAKLEIKEGYVGLYSVNKVTEVQLDGNRYPALRCSLSYFIRTVSALLSPELLSRFYFVTAEQGKPESCISFADATTLAFTSGEALETVYKGIMAGMYIAPTENAVMLRFGYR